MIRFLLFALPAIALMAADEPGWNKPLPEWSPADAQSLLTGSPWVKIITVGVARKLSEFERREGGNMTAEGGGKGVGFQALDGMPLLGIGPKPSAAPAVKDAGPKRLWVRWESALPVRAAELRAGDTVAPDLEGEDYAICIYNVPLTMNIIDMKTLPDSLKRAGTLKLDDRKEIKASRVLVRADGHNVATLVYFFPRKTNITAETRRIEFTAQVGRLILQQEFIPAEMRFQNKLAL